MIIADDVIEVCLLNAPLPIEGPVRLRAYLFGVVFCLPVTIDRDAAGLRGMKWLIRHCRLHLPATFAPHVIACASHGCALGKGRNHDGKDIVVALNSFSRQLRLPNVEPVLVESLLGQIAQNVRRELERRPAWLRDRTSRVMTLLFGEDAAYLRKAKKGGKVHEKRLLTVIRKVPRIGGPRSGRGVYTLVCC